MAHIKSSSMRKAMLFVVFVVGLLLATEARTQGDEFAPAPAPSMDAGAGFLVTYSPAFVCSSLLLSLLALLSH
ncbi:hypothetical protein SESBI_43472 [Sesbania bispinosa]|nr:hypothetical protein SESBI_43472 [Sesbania bispinosa]